MILHEHLHRSLCARTESLQIIPGSHRKVVPHVKATSEMAFGQMGDLGFIDTSGCVNLEMHPGEFVLFNERTLHHSDFLSFAKR